MCDKEKLHPALTQGSYIAGSLELDYLTYAAIRLRWGGFRIGDQWRQRSLGRATARLLK